jgi:UDP-galactopyranose mutase
MNTNEPGALITREYPRAWHKGDIKYYPVRNEDSEALFERYCAAAPPRLHEAGREIAR